MKMSGSINPPLLAMFLKNPKGSVMTFMALFIIGAIRSSIFGLLFVPCSMIISFLIPANVIGLWLIKASS
jgi:hypothetical protein